MATKLVLIQSIGKEQLELFHYIGKKFQLSVGVSISDCETKKDLLDLIEDFRLKGVELLA